MTDTATGVVLIGTCPICQEPRYRSKFPFTKPDDARAENFEPLGDAPVPRGEAPPLCHVCQSQLSFGKAPETQETRVPRRVESVRNITEKTAPAPRARINTIFDTMEGEVILDVRGTFVITNKRIVEIVA
jgi:hypothetical protein